MNKLAIVSASAITMLAAGLVLAHGDHKSEHGGNVGRGSDEIVVEFVMEKGTLKLYVHDDAGNPIETGKVEGTLTVISPRHPAQQVKLVADGEHRLSAPGVVPVQGDRLRALITLPSGEELESVASFAQDNRQKARRSGSAPPSPSGSVAATNSKQSRPGQ